MSCLNSILNPNEKSLLHPVLEQLDGNKALNWFNYIQSEEFKKMFGDYVAAYEDKSNPMKGRVYITGEPMLKFNKALGKHYFEDKDGEKYYYPHERVGIDGLFTTNEKNQLLGSIALAFAKKSGLNLDINELIATKVNDQPLIDFIDDFLDILSEDLKKDMSTFGLGVSVEQSLLFSKEWVTEIKQWFKKEQITLTEEEIEEETEQEKEDNSEQTRSELIKVAAYLKNSKDNMASNTKLFLSLIEGTKKNEFGRYTYVPFNDIYSTLNKILANTVAVIDESDTLEDIYDVYLSKINNLIKIKPWASNLLEKLNDKNVKVGRTVEQLEEQEQFKNQFVSAFNLHRNLFLGSEFSKRDKKITFSVKNLSDVGSRQTAVLSQWFENFSKLDKEDNLEIAIEDLQTIIQAFNGDRGVIEDKSILDLHIAKIRKGLADIGVHTSPEGFDFFLNNNSTDELSLKQKSQTLGKFINNLYSYVLKEYTNNKKDKKGLDLNLFKSQVTAVSLAKAEAFFMENSTDASIYTMGKTKWTYSNPSYLDIKIAIWKKNPKILYDHYMSDTYYENSVTMKYLLGMDKGELFDIDIARERLSKVQLGIFNSVQEKDDSINASDNNDISYTDALVDYVHKVLGQISSSKKTWHKTALAADKSTEYQINYGMDIIKAEANLIKDTDGQWNVKIHNKASNTLLGYFLDEYRRMNVTASEIASGTNLSPNKHTGPTNGLKSQMFPSLSFPLKAEVKDELGFDLYKSDGTPAFENLDTYKRQQLKNYISKIAGEKIKTTYDQLIEENIIGYNSKGELVNNSLDDTLFEAYKSANITVAKAALALAGDLFINSVISQAEYAKLFTGDLAYYKSMIDYRKRVPATYTDGLYMRLKDNEKEFTISVIESVEIDEPTLEYMKMYTSPEVWQKYTRKNEDDVKGPVDSTDAQAWITPKRWEFIMKRLGKWSDIHTSVYKKMGEDNAVYSAQERKVLAQPLKGVYFDVKDGKPTYLKYSQAVLVPGLVKNNPYLRKLSVKMANQQIDELVTSGGIKVGMSIPAVTHDANGNILDDFKLNTIQLNNAAWKLQQDLPTKGVKLTDLGSQIQKNVYQGLVYHQNLIFDIDERNGSEMIDYLNELSSTMLEQNLTKVLEELGVNSETLQIENEDVLYKSIITQLEKRRDVPSNLINALRAGLSPYGIPGGNEIFQNVFSSIINNKVNKIKTQGGGFIQMADYGLTKDEASKKGITYTPWFIAGEEDRAHVPKFEFNPKTGKDKLVGGGIFLPASVIAKYIPDYAKYSPEQLFGTLNKKTGEYENGMIDQEILENIIGYRIPNQGLASNDAFRVIGILPEAMGDTVIAYAGITKKTGSDYDIDKMYLMTAATILNEVTGRLEYVRPEVDNDGVELAMYLQSNEVLQNKLIEAYKAILLQGDKELMDKIMNPIDIEFMEEDILNLNREKAPSDFENFSALDDLKTKIKFKTSKTGLGVAVNNTMDFVQGAMGNLVAKKTITFGNLKGENVFDEEFSEELTNEELHQYVEEFNKRVPDDEKITFDSIKKYKKIALADSLMALTNGFVDVANKPYITEGNWVNQTNNLGFMLLRRGVHPFRINAFLNQPIIKSFVAHKNNIESKTVESTRNPVMSFKLASIAKKLDGDKIYTIAGKSATVRKMFYNTIVDIKNIEYKNANAISENEDDIEAAERASFVNQRNTYYRGIRFKIGSYFDISADDVIDHPVAGQIYKIINDTVRESFSVVPAKMEDIDFKRLRKQNIPLETEESVQETMLDFYLKWTQMAKPLTANVAASKVDVNGKGKNITSTIIAINKFKLAKSSKELLGFDTKLTRNGKRTPLQTSMDVAVTTPFNIMVANPKYFALASPVVARTFNMVSKLIYGEEGKYLTNEKLADKLTRAYSTYLLSGFAPFRIEDSKRKDIIYNMYEKYQAQLKANPDNMFLKELIPIEGDNNVFFLGMSNAGRTSFDKNAITDSWRDLLENSETEEFAEEMIKYAYLMSGGNKTSSQFYEFIPYEWFNRNGFNKYLNTFNNSKDIKNIDNTFLAQFFRHGLDDKTITTVENGELYMKYLESPLSSKEAVLRKSPPRKGGKTPYTISLEEEVATGPESFKTLVRKYMFIDTIGVNKHPIYGRVTSLGIRDGRGNIIPEYNSSKNVTHTMEHLSIFESNNDDKKFNTSRLIDFLNGITNIEKSEVITDTEDITMDDLLALDKSNTPHIAKIREGKEEVIKEGIPEIFIENSELSNIGTPQQYFQYLDTIFPDSKVKEIVYHTTPNKFEKFDKNFLQKGIGNTTEGIGFYFSNRKGSYLEYKDIVNIQNEITKDNEAKELSINNLEKYKSELEAYLKNILGLELNLDDKEFINDNELPLKVYEDYNTYKKVADNYFNLKNSLEAQGINKSMNEDSISYEENILSRVEDSEANLLNVILNIKTPKIFKERQSLKDNNTLKNNDGTITIIGKDDIQYVVFEPEQIHILGSKQDIEGFKNFVKKEVENLDISEKSHTFVEKEYIDKNQLGFDFIEPC